MQNKLPISVLIPTLNEAKNLKELLPLLSWAAEILIVDSFSTDDSATVAAQYNSRFLSHQYLNPSAQKNWAILQCSQSWILILDADERPTPELIEELAAFSKTNNENNIQAFWIYRENYFLNQKVNYSGWQKDKVVRFIKKSDCLYHNVNVHEEINTNNIKVSSLNSKIQHYTYVSLDHFIDKLQRYASWSAMDYEGKTATVGFYQLYLKPFFRFFKHYILQRGFLDGKAGLIIATLMAFGVFLRYAKIYENRLK